MRILTAITVFILITLVSILSSNAYAQPVTNGQELSGSAAFFRPIGSGEGNFNLDAAYGYYMEDPHWQLGIRQSFNLNYNKNESDVWNAVTAPFFNYHFFNDELFGLQLPKTVSPYIGGLVGAVWNDKDFSGTVGPQIGVKAYFTEASFIGIGYRYEWFFDKIHDVDKTQNANHVVSVGFGHSWQW